MPFGIGLPPNISSDASIDRRHVETDKKHIIRDFSKDRKPIVRDLAGEWAKSKREKAGQSKVATAEELYSQVHLGHEKETFEPASDKASGVGDFMRLFLTQLQCQDPLNPTEGKDFVAQLAQFNSVEQLQKVNTGIKDIADSFRSNRILAATSMIGKQMKVPTSKMQLTKGDKIEGVMKIPPLKHGQHILEGTIEISNDKGEVIARPPFLKEKAIPGKEYEFDWDGTDANHMRIRDSAGNEIEDGNYKIVAKLKISGTDQGDDWIPIPTVIKTKVSSVSITDSGEIEFSATGIGTLTLPELREISDREISDRKATTEVEELAEAILSRTRLVQQPTAALGHAVVLPQAAPLVDVRS